MGRIIAQQSAKDLSRQHPRRGRGLTAGRFLAYARDMAPTAGIIVIGNEVLSGKVEEENARYLIRELRALGVDLMRVVFIRDDVPTIARDVREMSAAYTHVFTSGGVGATHDDVTMPALAEAFGVPMIPHPVLMPLIEQHFGERINVAVRRMGILPEGTELLGLGELRYPVIKLRNVFVFPGVPQYLKMKFDFLRPHLKNEPIRLRQVYLRVGEDQIALPLGEVDAAFPAVEFGSYPRFDSDEYRVKLTIESRDLEQLEAGLAALLARMDPGWIVKVETVV